MEDGMYHAGNRALQDEFDSRRLADRLEEARMRTAFNDDDRAFIGSSILFFLATADHLGQPDCSIKGGAAGFVRVVSDNELAFPDYDGNGMFKSLGNILVNSHVGLLFVDFTEGQRKLRVNGTASLHGDDALLHTMPGAKSIVRVRARHIFPNCPRYLPRMQLLEESVYAPRVDHEPPDPLWEEQA